jgi:GrpB-like predicted nucleotidyltransferase (UPF0157 family)
MSKVELVPHNPALSRQFEAEAPRLLQALGGWAWEGGQVFSLEHVGSTSIPGVVAKPCVDIAIAVYPFPLEQTFIMALESLGYDYKGEHGISGRQYFQRGPHDYHLHVYEAGSDLFVEHVLFRDYLRTHQEARQRYENLKLGLAQSSKTRVAYTDGKVPLIQVLIKEALEWHIQTTQFRDVKFVKQELGHVAVLWCVASGWGLDIFLNKVTRLHHDVDVCIWRSDQKVFLKHLRNSGWDVQVVYEAGKYRAWQEDEFLDLPISQVHARRNDMTFELLDILFMESDEANWKYRREPKVTMPKAQVMEKARDLFILNPAITLLFKSRTADKEPRGKDQKDFEGVLPNLTQEQKRWLENAFEIWLPGHPWRKKLKI